MSTGRRTKVNCEGNTRTLTAAAAQGRSTRVATNARHHAARLLSHPDFSPDPPRPPSSWCVPAQRAHCAGSLRLTVTARLGQVTRVLRITSDRCQPEPTGCWQRPSCPRPPSPPPPLSPLHNACWVWPTLLTGCEKQSGSEEIHDGSGGNSSECNAEQPCTFKGTFRDIFPSSGSLRPTTSRPQFDATADETRVTDIRKLMRTNTSK